MEGTGTGEQESHWEWKCSQHPTAPFKGACRVCGRLLCDDCLKRHTPPLCSRCIMEKCNAARRNALLSLGLLGIGFLIGTRIPSPFTGVLYDLAGLGRVRPNPFFSPHSVTPLANGILFALHIFAFKPAIAILGAFNSKAEVYGKKVSAGNGDAGIVETSVLFVSVLLTLSVMGLSIFHGQIMLPVLVLYYCREWVRGGIQLRKL